MQLKSNFPLCMGLWSDFGRPFLFEKFRTFLNNVDFAL